MNAYVYFRSPTEKVYIQIRLRSYTQDFVAQYREILFRCWPLRSNGLLELPSNFLHSLSYQILQFFYATFKRYTNIFLFLFKIFFFLLFLLFHYYFTYLYTYLHVTYKKYMIKFSYFQMFQISAHIVNILLKPSVIATMERFSKWKVMPKFLATNCYEQE